MKEGLKRRVKEGLRDERRAQKEGDFMDNFIERSSEAKIFSPNLYTNTHALPYGQSQ
jgi:hypothetical protein